jgi:hypothetical protein
MIVVILTVWLAWTHLVGRFAIVLIVPCAVILGHTWQSLRTAAWRAGGAAVLAAVLCCNTVTTIGLFRPGTESFLTAGLFGRLDWIKGGTIPHIPKLNALLDSGERVLVVADARRFYLNAGADYCVVFNRNPFAEAAAELSPEALMDWLRDRGYRYVYLDRVEMWRLRNSRYGFWASVDEALFDRLAQHGLRPVEVFRTLAPGYPYGVLFGVMPSADAASAPMGRR